MCIRDSLETATIPGGTFPGAVTNNAGITYDFQSQTNILSQGKITGGTCQGTVTNNGARSENGTFTGDRVNKKALDQNGKALKGDDEKPALGLISGGTFEGPVTNELNCAISGGTFNGTVTNKGDLENGTFNGDVTNDQGGGIPVSYTHLAPPSPAPLRTCPAGGCRRC